jgi:hypothetical protein
VGRASGRVIAFVGVSAEPVAQLATMSESSHDLDIGYFKGRVRTPYGLPRSVVVYSCS